MVREKIPGSFSIPNWWDENEGLIIIYQSKRSDESLV